MVNFPPFAATIIIFAPFTTAQIESLNGFQKSGIWHAFTCGENHAEDDTLVATEMGWICPNCSYVQDWAHSFMADWSWKQCLTGITE